MANICSVFISQNSNLKADIPYIIESGYAQITRESGRNETTVTFTQPFTTNPIVFCTVQTNEPDRFIPNYDSITKTGFTARLYNTGASATGTIYYRWMAIGN